VHNCSIIFARWCQCPHPYNTHSTEPTPLTIPNGSFISTAFFAWLMPHFPYKLHCATPFPPKFAPYHRGAGPPSNTWFLGPTRSTTSNHPPSQSSRTFFPEYTFISSRQTNGLREQTWNQTSKNRPLTLKSDTQLNNYTCTLAL